MFHENEERVIPLGPAGDPGRTKDRDSNEITNGGKLSEEFVAFVAERGLDLDLGALPPEVLELVQQALAQGKREQALSLVKEQGELTRESKFQDLEGLNPNGFSPMEGWKGLQPLEEL